MSEETLKPNNNTGKWIIIGVAAAILFVFAGILLFWQAGNKIQTAQTVKNTAVNSEAEDAKAINRSAIEAAQNIPLKTVRPVDASDHVRGDIKAPVQFIVYDDFECPFCAEFYLTLKEVKEYFGDQIVIAFRHYPLTIHPMAVTAALASECAAEQGKFWEMYDKLFAANLANRFTPAEFKTAAAELGLDAPKFNQCLDTEKYLEKVQTQMLEGRNVDIIGTPGNFINNKPYPGAVPFEDYTDSTGQARYGLKTIIEKELGK